MSAENGSPAGCFWTVGAIVGMAIFLAVNPKEAGPMIVCCIVAGVIVACVQKSRGNNSGSAAVPLGVSQAIFRVTGYIAKSNGEITENLVERLVKQIKNIDPANERALLLAFASGKAEEYRPDDDIAYLLNNRAQNPEYFKHLTDLIIRVVTGPDDVFAPLARGRLDDIAVKFGLNVDTVSELITNARSTKNIHNGRNETNAGNSSGKQACNVPGNNQEPAFEKITESIANVKIFKTDIGTSNVPLDVLKVIFCLIGNVLKKYNSDYLIKDLDDIISKIDATNRDVFLEAFNSGRREGFQPDAAVVSIRKSLTELSPGSDATYFVKYCQHVIQFIVFVILHCCGGVISEEAKTGVESIKLKFSSNADGNNRAGGDNTGTGKITGYCKYQDF